MKGSKAFNRAGSGVLGLAATAGALALIAFAWDNLWAAGLLLLAVGLCGTAQPAEGQAYGMGQRPVVGAFLDGALPGLTYRLEYSDNLVGSNWVSVPPPVFSSNLSLTMTATNAGGLPRGFYRIVEQLP